jgi:hypothetical protein
MKTDYHSRECLLIENKEVVAFVLLMSRPKPEPDAWTDG